MAAVTRRPCFTGGGMLLEGDRSTKHPTPAIAMRAPLADGKGHSLRNPSRETDSSEQRPSSGQTSRQLQRAKSERSDAKGHVGKQPSTTTPNRTK